MMSNYFNPGRRLESAIVLCLLLTLAGCDITLKKRTTQKLQPQSPEIEAKKMTNTDEAEGKKDGGRFSRKSKEKQARARGLFAETDKQRINGYYKDPANAAILEDMRTLTRVTKKQEKKLQVTKPIPAELRLMPLPLELEKILNPLNSRMLRVQIDRHIVIMDVKSRQIIDMMSLDAE